MTEQQARRIFTRSAVHIGVEVRPEGGLPRRGVVHDLSFNGVSVNLPGYGLTEGTECEITLVLEGGARQIRLPGRGRVAWVGQRVVAFSFTAVDGDVYQHFERLVLMNAPDPNQVERELQAHPDSRPPMRRPAND